MKHEKLKNDKRLDSVNSFGAAALSTADGTISDAQASASLRLWIVALMDEGGRKVVDYVSLYVHSALVFQVHRPAKYRPEIGLGRREQE